MEFSKALWGFSYKISIDTTTVKEAKFSDGESVEEVALHTYCALFSTL